MQVPKAPFVREIEMSNGPFDASWIRVPLYLSVIVTPYSSIQGDPFLPNLQVSPAALSQQELLCIHLPTE